MQRIFLRVLAPSSVFHQLLPPAAEAFLDRWSSRPSGNSYWGERAKRYESIRISQGSWSAEQHGVARALRGLKDLGSVLDAPVGTGRFFEYYQNAGLSVTGLDVSEDMLEQCRQRAAVLNFPVTLVRGQAMAMNFPDASFDLAVCFRFLHSIISLGEARDVLRELARVTRKYALIELGFRDTAEPRRFQPSEKAAMLDKFSMEEVRNMLNECGLAVVQIYGPFQEGNKAQYGFLCEKES